MDPLSPSLTLLAAAARREAGGAARLAVVLHAGVEGRVDQAGLVRQQRHGGGGGGAVAGQRGDGELRRAVGALALLRAPLPVRREPIVRGPFAPAHREGSKGQRRRRDSCPTMNGIYIGGQKVIFCSLYAHVRRGGGVSPGAVTCDTMSTSLRIPTNTL